MNKLSIKTLGWKSIFLVMYTLVVIIIILPIVSFYWIADKHKIYFKQCELPHIIINELRLEKFYRIGFIGGFLFGISILRSPKIFRSLKFGRLSGLWSNYILIIDGFNDKYGGAPVDSSLSILTSYIEIFKELSKCSNINTLYPSEENLQAIRQAVKSIKHLYYQNQDQNQKPQLITLKSSSILATVIGNMIVQFTLSSNVAEQNAQILSKNFTDLAIGQINSHKQLASNNDLNDVSWKWFCNHVLHQKTWPIFSLNDILPRSTHELHRKEIMNISLNIINDIFIHRQLLDDLDDIEEDCKSGIYGAPAYLLKESLSNNKMDFDEASNRLYNVSIVMLKPYFGSMHKYQKFAIKFVKRMKDGDYIRATKTLIDSGVPAICIKSIEQSSELNLRLHQIKTNFGLHNFITPICSFFFFSCIRSLNKSKIKY